MDLLCIDNSMANGLRRRIEKSVNYMILRIDSSMQNPSVWWEMKIQIPSDAPVSFETELIDCKYELWFRTISYRKSEELRIPIVVQDSESTAT